MRFADEILKTVVPKLYIQKVMEDGINLPNRENQIIDGKNILKTIIPILYAQGSIENSSSKCDLRYANNILKTIMPRLYKR